MQVGQAVVVIPAHNEVSDLPSCLKAMVTAAACAPFPVKIVVVLDACDDDSRELAGQFGDDVQFVEVDVRNVGAARRAGFEYAQQLSVTDSRTWYATTDADTRVDADWVVRQTDSAADVVLGVVRIVNWRRFSPAAARRYLSAYRSKFHAGGHGHVHGANMGFSAEAYWGVGGFAPLSSDEDVDLARRFEAAGYRIARDNQLSVVTSARRIGRAPRGFAKHLRNIAPRARRGTV